MIFYFIPRTKIVVFKNNEVLLLHKNPGIQKLSKRSIILTCVYTYSSPSPSKGPTSKERSLTYDSMNFWKFNNSKQGQKEEPQRAKPVNYLEEKRSLLFWNLKFFYVGY